MAIKFVGAMEIMNKRRPSPGHNLDEVVKIISYETILIYGTLIYRDGNAPSFLCSVVSISTIFDDQRHPCMHASSNAFIATGVNMLLGL